MNNLLIFLAIPFLVIVVAIALQKLLKNPLLISLIVFAVFLVVAFAIGNLNYIVAGIIYAIIAYLAAVISCIICKICRKFNCSCFYGGRNNTETEVLSATSPIAISNCNCGNNSASASANANNGLITLNGNQAVVSSCNCQTNNPSANALAGNSFVNSSCNCGCNNNRPATQSDINNVLDAISDLSDSISNNCNCNNNSNCGCNFRNRCYR